MAEPPHRPSASVPTGSERRRIVFLGPPGAGKGTQAVGIARAHAIAHLSTGDLLREAVRRRTPLGAEANRYMNEGQLVPDALVLRLLQERMTAPDCRNGFLLDGFPRNAAQAEALEAIASIDRVIFFEIPESVLVERLTARRRCPKCGTLYNLVSRPPKRPGRCDLDGEELAHRPDDNEPTARARLRVYLEETLPLLEYYRRRGLLVGIDASGSLEAVEARIERALR
ncbi:MAG: adenylate kinase [Thermoplasmata archaeon]|nr:adenylate kinase [Thermoplasmata archaeon]